MRKVDLWNAYETNVGIVESPWLDRDGVEHHAPPGFAIVVDAEDVVIAFVKEETFPNGTTRAQVIVEILNKAENHHPFEKEEE